MRVRIVLPLAAAAALVGPIAARGDSRHVVARGESLTSIAAADGISVAALAAANHIPPDTRLIAGSVLLIPSRPGHATQRRAAAPTTRYVVRRGDTLSAIAARTGHSVGYLTWVNHLRHPGQLDAGTVLTIPGSTTAVAAPHTTARRPTRTRYVVRRGDTLSAIAARTGHSVSYLAWVNHLRHPGRLGAGTVLTIPGSTTAVAAPHTTPRRPTRTRYVVRRGDTLSAIAARTGHSVGYLAWVNHLHDPGRLGAGTVLEIPGGGTAPVPTTTTTRLTTTRYVIRRGDTLSAIAARTGHSVGYLAWLNHLHEPGLLVAGTVLEIPGSSGAHTPTRLSSAQRYLVQPGDTLSGIAARAGISLGALAAANGISATGVLFAGATLVLPPGSQPVGPAVGADEPPYPTPERVTASQVEQIAAANGVPAPLAAAIGWQESGFNNNVVSSADARGVMQILPKTWSWIERSLDTGTPLAPASALDNVRGGVLLLRSLLMATHGNTALAAAGYIQGLRSVRAHGMFSDTRQYVTDVLALRRMFGGP
jgi:LysM repeat protein